jgi:hypothetical protein
VIKVPWLRRNCSAGDCARAARTGRSLTIERCKRPSFLQRTFRVPARLPGRCKTFAGGERGEILRAYRRRAGWRPCRGSEFQGRGRSPELQVPGRIVPRVGFPRRFPGEFVNASLAGGEDCGYFALGAGDAGSNPAAGICARVAKR